jgi:hypothetical protein
LPARAPGRKVSRRTKVPYLASVGGMETGGIGAGRDSPLAHLPTGGRRSATLDRGQLDARNLATAGSRVDEGTAAAQDRQPTASPGLLRPFVPTCRLTGVRLTPACPSSSRGVPDDAVTGCAPQLNLRRCPASPSPTGFARQGAQCCPCRDAALWGGAHPSGGLGRPCLCPPGGHAWPRRQCDVIRGRPCLRRPCGGLRVHAGADGSRWTPQSVTAAQASGSGPLTENA